MRTIRISEGVWQAIAERGRFGENEDDVLHRVFKLPPGVANGDGSEASSAHQKARSRGRRRNLTKQRLSAYVENRNLVLAFAGGPERRWRLSDKGDKTALKRVRTEAVEFAKEAGATLGQVNAVKKALTEADYHLTK